jgi:predicted helicase
MTKKAQIHYFRFPNCKDKEEKLRLIDSSKFKDLPFNRILPDKNNNWINQTDNDFESLMPVCDKQVKLGKSQNAIFKLFSLGVVTSRDEWVYSDNEQNLINKVKHLIKTYNAQIGGDDLDYSIKWSRAVKKDLEQSIKYQFDADLIIESLYRPFSNKKLYFSKQLNEMQYQLPHIFGKNSQLENKVIMCSSGQRNDFLTLASDKIPSLDVFMPNATQCLPLHVYDIEGNRHENITNWALNQFKNRYEIELTKTDIFHYVYAVLHNPSYREKYEQNLKREFPRVPFYDDFSQWVEWGKTLMALHLNYETVEPYPLKRVDSKASKIPKAKLKADKTNGVIELDENTSLSGIPVEAWDYKLGNRSALEWILDQYKEKKPKDATIAEKFNVYRFADYKESVIDLLMRVCRVSVETVKIVDAM